MTDLDLLLLLSVQMMSLPSTSSFASEEHTSLVVKYCITHDPLYCSLVLRCSVFAKSDWANSAWNTLTFSLNSKGKIEVTTAKKISLIPPLFRLDDNEIQPQANGDSPD